MFEYSEDGYRYLNTAKFDTPDGNESWIRIQKEGKNVEINARLKIITNFGQNTEYKLFDILHTARGTQYGFAISNNTGKALVAYVYGNKRTLYVKTGGNTLSTGDYLWINIDIFCID